MKYKVQIEGYIEATQYAIIEAESIEEAIDLFNSAHESVDYDYWYGDFEPAEGEEPVASEDVE